MYVTRTDRRKISCMGVMMQYVPYQHLLWRFQKKTIRSLIVIDEISRFRPVVYYNDWHKSNRHYKCAKYVWQIDNILIYHDNDICVNSDCKCKMNNKRRYIYPQSNDYVHSKSIEGCLCIMNESNWGSVTDL